jgi:hypothetical protein
VSPWDDPHGPPKNWGDVGNPTQLSLGNTNCLIELQKKNQQRKEINLAVIVDWHESLGGFLPYVGSKKKLVSTKVLTSKKKKVYYLFGITVN